MKYLSPLLIAFFISGCVPAMNTIAPFESSNQRFIGKEPNHNKRTRAEIGDAIYTEFDYSSSSSPIATIKEESLVLDKVMEKGTILNGMKIDGRKSYCTKSINFQSGWHPCLTDTNDDGMFDMVTNLGNGFDNSFKILSKKIKFTKSANTASRKDGFKKEIIYQGLSGNSLSIAYREFNNDFARPAYTQTVSYDVNNSGEGLIGFKGARIKVIKASGIYIDYVVTHGFK